MTKLRFDFLLDFHQPFAARPQSFLLHCPRKYIDVSFPSFMQPTVSFFHLIYMRGINRVLYGIIIHKELPCGMAWETVAVHGASIYLSVIDFWLLSLLPSKCIYKILHRANCQIDFEEDVARETMSTEWYVMNRCCANIWAIDDYLFQ